MPAGLKDEVGGRHDGQRQQAAQREADEDVRTVGGEVLLRPVLLDCAAREEEDLVGGHRRAEERDGEVGEGEARLRPRHLRMAGRVEQAAPVRSHLPDGHDEHEQAEAEEAEHALHRVEGHPPDDEPHEEGDEGDEEEVADAGRQRQRDRHTGQLGREGQKVDEERGQEVGQPHARAQPLTHQVEHRPAGQGCDTTTHLRVDDDPDDAEDHRPRQVHAEASAGRRVGHEVADVDEAADGREDAEEDGDEPLHPYRATNASSAAASACSGAATRSSSSI